MIRPCETHVRELKPNGLIGRLIKKYSYVVTLCKINEPDVLAVRFDGYERKTDIHKACEEKYPSWNIKTISRLYDEDFEP